MLSPLDYYISKEELKGPVTKWATYVLQTNYAEKICTPEGKVFHAFCLWFKDNRSKLLTASLDEANEIIYNKVFELKLQNPHAFPEGLGWWSKKKLVSLYEEGHIIIDNYGLEEQKRDMEVREKQKEEFLIEQEEQRQKKLEKDRIEKEKLEAKMKLLEESRQDIEVGMAFNLRKDALMSFIKLDLDLCEGFSVNSSTSYEFSKSFFKLERIKTEVGLRYVVTEVYRPGPKAYSNLIKGKVCLA